VKAVNCNISFVFIIGCYGRDDSYLIIL
jgi:hypothetical protein